LGLVEFVAKLMAHPVVVALELGSVNWDKSSHKKVF